MHVTLLLKAYAFWLLFFFKTSRIIAKNPNALHDFCEIVSAVLTIAHPFAINPRQQQQSEFFGSTPNEFVFFSKFISNNFNFRSLRRDTRGIRLSLLKRGPRKQGVHVAIVALYLSRFLNLSRTVSVLKRSGTTCSFANKELFTTEGWHQYQRIYSIGQAKDFVRSQKHFARLL